MSSTPFRRLARAAAASVALAFGALAVPAFAQEPDATDPPGRVARVAEAAGQVWVYSPDTGEWVSAERNQPLTSGDRIATDAGARAELQVGSTSLRLDSASELEIVQLDDEQVSLQLHEGSAIARVRDHEGAGQLDVATDEGRFVVLQAGAYRFDRGNGKSDLTVYAGQARYEGQNSGLTVAAGQRGEFWIDSGGVAQYSLFAPVNDAFAGWSSERDRRYSGSESERYVSPEMTGAAELDNYGRWEQTADYGAVWYPTTVAADWAPYSQGRWTWVRPWGWTWVDAAPWGFAPFHYGRWVHLRNRWCWTPGQRVSRPVYAPALVAWVGGSRGNVSVTIGGGPAVGWFPLAPREVYVPSYRVSSRYARNVNITHVANVGAINSAFSNPQGRREFANRRFPGGITVVPTGVMTERRPVAPAAAQFRQSPGFREFTNRPTRVIAQVTAPVAAPALPARSPDARPVRPPPGFAGRPDGAGRPGFDRRDRDDDAGRDRRSQRDADRPARPEFGGSPRIPMTAQPGTVQAPTPAAQPTAPAVQRPFPGSREREFTNRPAMPPQRPAVAPPLQEVPMMRPLPVQRREERGADERRGPPQRPAEVQRAPQPQMQVQTKPQPQPQPQVRAPQMQRPAPPQPVQRPVDVPRPVVTPPAAPPVQRVEPPRPPETRGPRSDNPRGEFKRGERNQL